MNSSSEGSTEDSSGGDCEAMGRARVGSEVVREGVDEAGLAVSGVRASSEPAVGVEDPEGVLLRLLIK